MTPARAAPRLDQIDLLTRGVTLPAAAVDDEHLLLVAEVLLDAWERLVESHPAVLTAGSEAEVTALMETQLCRLLRTNLPWGQIAWGVTRGKETVSFNGERLEGRPDLSIHLTRRGPSFPLIVECKVIDAGNQKGVDLYCNEGLRRFLTGQYGWALRESFMLAYVRDGSSIASALAPRLASRPHRSTDPYATDAMPTALPVTIPGGASGLARSRHQRSFRYPLRTPPDDAPGPIVLWHLWLA